MLSYVQTADTPGGAASSDGKTMLLVYRGFWRCHLLWSLWTEQGGWTGNRLIQLPMKKNPPLLLESNGRGPTVVFCDQQYWVFYVDDDEHICSVSFSTIHTSSGLPLWKMPRTYVNCASVADGRPCVLPKRQEGERSQLCVYYNSTQGLACLVLDSNGSTLKFYSYGRSYLDGFQGSPTLFSFHCLHLFYRNHKNKLCWYTCQEQVTKHAWTQASDVDLLGLQSCHAAACYVNADGELCVLCSTHPSLWAELHTAYSEQPAIRCNTLLFHKQDSL